MRLICKSPFSTWFLSVSKTYGNIGLSKPRLTETCSIQNSYLNPLTFLWLLFRNLCFLVHCSQFYLILHILKYNNQVQIDCRRNLIISLSYMHLTQAIFGLHINSFIEDKLNNKEIHFKDFTFTNHFHYIKPCKLSEEYFIY